MVSGNLQRGSLNAYRTYRQRIHRFLSHRVAEHIGQRGWRFLMHLGGQTSIACASTGSLQHPEQAIFSLHFPGCKMKLPSSILSNFSASDRRQKLPPPAPVLLAVPNPTVLNQAAPMAIDALSLKAAPLQGSEKQPACSFSCISITCKGGMCDTITLLFVTPSLSVASIQGPQRVLV